MATMTTFKKLTVIASLSAGLFACGDNVTSTKQATTPETKNTSSLKEAYAGRFLIGATLNDDLVAHPDSAKMQLVKKHFSAATMDNAFKWGVINPQPDDYRFTAPDNFVNFTNSNEIKAIGHVLFWHSQTPDWVFKDEQGNLLSREALLKRMRERASMMANRFGDKIKIWDVVNEAIEDDGSLRNSLYHQIIGDDFIEQAFYIANDVLPADAIKIYNDYGMTREGRRSAVIAMVNDFKARGVPIDAIGIQGHWGMKTPTLDEIDNTLTVLAATGLPLHITELDLDYLGREQFFGANVDIDKLEATPENNPYPDGNFPASADKELGDRYADIFRLFLKHQQQIDRVTFWGVTDAESWLNGWPVAGRTNYPLLFNHDGSPKQALQQVIDVGNNAKM
ncbi:endo-1,4-beta-xylanase [Neptunicella marina]|uniref:Beta-xylanase n=1 Tax=Neptunicella marina TaxID=2125989 RepID=A0A8J6IUQ8_9ALTE|nr:endo-1,4-beta-xylanase [Neptunicella marina]MBC3766200.1 endo-1,4-beta-xylanase [Neptunicella marina]